MILYTNNHYQSDGALDNLIKQNWECQGFKSFNNMKRQQNNIIVI